jgi:hypothetical protein
MIQFLINGRPSHTVDLPGLNGMSSSEGFRRAEALVTKRLAFLVAGSV